MLEFNGNMLIKNFKQAVQEAFGITIKVHQGFSMGQTADDGATVAATRSGSGDSPTGTIRLESSMTVEQAERAFREAAGFAVQILAPSGGNAPNDATLASLGFRAAVPPARTEAPAAPTSGTSVSVTGQKKLSTLQEEFTSRFPLLGLMFFSLEEAKKAQGGAHIRPLPSNQTIATVRTKSGSGDMSIHGNTTIGTLEGGFRDDYGLHVQVCCMHEGKPAYTGAAHDALSLSEMNRRSAERGRGAFVYPAT